MQNWELKFSYQLILLKLLCVMYCIIIFLFSVALQSPDLFSPSGIDLLFSITHICS